MDTGPMDTSRTRPKLEYASSAWSPQSSGKVKRLESVQNKAARFVTRSYDRTTSVTQLKSNLERVIQANLQVGANGAVYTTNCGAATMEQDYGRLVCSHQITRDNDSLET